jgi:uncharacterized protein YceK
MRTVICNKIKFFMIICLSLLLTGCGFVIGSSNPAIDKGIKQIDKIYPDDNFVEERIEGGIQTLTGLDLDLTPRSPEKK